MSIFVLVTQIPTEAYEGILQDPKNVGHLQ